MYDKEKGLFEAFVAKKMSRRELIQATGKAGLSASAAGFLLTQAQTSAMAADFDWQKHKGTKLKLLLNKHPYADAMIANIETFKNMTGMDISWDIFPEDVYFDKVTAALSSGSTEYE
jgi:multiple sugar transport system substrate-binding protein